MKNFNSNPSSASRSLPFLTKSALLTAFSLLAFQAAPLLGDGVAQPVNPPCEPIARTFVFTVFQFTSATTAVGQGIIYDAGQPVGTFDAKYSNIHTKGNPTQGNGVIQMNGQHTMTFTDGSTLLTHDEILLEPENQNPGWMRANSRLYLVDGSGVYAGATGLLHTHGEVNVFTVPPQGSIDFSGQVCVP
jgi:hypothetical protein